jgi:hypothetical protein
MKATAQTVFIWLFLVFVTGSSLYLYIKEQGNSRRLLYDLKAANEQAEDFKTREGHQASKLKAQELTISELRRINPQIIAQLKNLDIRPRLVTSYTQAAQTFQAEIRAPVKDSIVNVPASTDIKQDAREPQKIKVLKYRDKWISITGVLDPDTAKIKVAATDTIFTGIYKGDRRRPWLWILSKRQYTAAATNRSPYIKIQVIQSGVIKK